MSRPSCVYTAKRKQGFGLEFTKLRTLKVSMIEAWPEIVGRNLTRITIRSRLNPMSLKRCISYSPNLKVLGIHEIRTFGDPDTSTWQRIALPPGARLKIKHSNKMIPQILAVFSLPGDGHIKVEHRIVSVPRMPLPRIPLLSYILPVDLSHLQFKRDPFVKACPHVQAC